MDSITFFIWLSCNEFNSIWSAKQKNKYQKKICDNQNFLYILTMSIINSIQIYFFLFLIHYCKFCFISISWNIQNMSNLSCESINIHLIETIKMLFRQFFFKFTGNCCLSGCQKKYKFFYVFLFLTNVLNHEMCAINLQLDVFVFVHFSLQLSNHQLHTLVIYQKVLVTKLSASLLAFKFQKNFCNSFFYYFKEQQQKIYIAKYDEW